MNEEYENEEEKSSLDSVGETIRRNKALYNGVHRNHNLKIGHRNRNQINSNPANNSLASKISPAKSDSLDMDDDQNVSSIGKVSNNSNMVSGIYSTGKFLVKHKWLLIIGSSSVFFFLILIIASVFLVQNSSAFNYASGNSYDNTEYQRIYQEIETISNEYKSQYGVTVDKHLIISVLTSYKDNSAYADDTDSDIFDILEDYGNRSKISAMIETLAKYQLKTVTICDYDSSSMRKIASNDDSVSITNFWTTELSREKNYDCRGTSSDIDYVISTEKGNLEDENSGSVFYWNLIDEEFFKEYYPDYFKDLSGEDYQKKAAETLDYMYVYAETLKKYDTTTSGSNVVSKNLYWWPIGSVETTTSNGVTFASGEPAPSTILTRFASKGALEIYSEEESINIIAAKGGTVFFATSDSTTIDSEYGYYVVIEHSDGLYTYYGHLAPNSITVKQGDEVAQGQVIGRMGSSGNTASPKLHFEMREGGQLVSNRVNPEEYVDINDPRYYNGEFSLTTTSLSKTEFIALMNRYCITSNNKPFCDNFAAHAEEIYDVSLSSNVNPELVVITAGTEQAWKQTCGFNYWGINIANGEGCSSGGQYASLKEGIQAYAKVINNYLEGGAHSSLIIQRYKERSKAGCDSGGHGLPGTLAGMQSVYSWVGDYRMNPGSAGYGGCYYFQYIYGKDYCDKISTCKGTSYQNRVEECGASAKTTVCEQNDYTIYQLRDKTDFRLKIFGL